MKQLLGGNSKAADALLESCPSLADASNLKAVLAEASRLFGAADGTAAARLLLNSPELADMCQSLKHQSRGERDTDYLRDIYTAGGDD